MDYNISLIGVTVYNIYIGQGNYWVLYICTTCFELGIELVKEEIFGKPTHKTMDFENILINNEHSAWFFNGNVFTKTQSGKSVKFELFDGLRFSLGSSKFLL